MEVDSVESLCKFLISCAFQRCRMLDDLCRLSVSLRPAPPLVRISVSDTGTGSTLEEFQEVTYQNDPILATKWDGVLCIATTRISEKEIHHLKFDLKELTSSRRLVRLPSTTKNGAKFSGTEVSLSVHEQMDCLATMISIFIQKILLLKAPKIAVELSVESAGYMDSQSKSIVLENACGALPMYAANIDCLKLGLEDYVSKHGNRLVEACQSCFLNGKNLKVGTGIAYSRGNQQSGGVVMEVVIINSEISIPNQSSCSRLYGRRTEDVSSIKAFTRAMNLFKVYSGRQLVVITLPNGPTVAIFVHRSAIMKLGIHLTVEVLCFRDFSPCSISQSSLDALTSIDWKNYGLVLRSVGDQDGVTLLEWENLPPCAHIDIVLHRYHKQVMILPNAQSNQSDRYLTRKAAKLALNELKQKNVGVLLSERAIKVCRYAPDLAKTISGLILSSGDMNFQGECFSLLGLHSQENDRNLVEKCIKDRIISVIARNDRNPAGAREASCLFADDDTHHEPYGPDDEYDEGDEAFSY